MALEMVDTPSPLSSPSEAVKPIARPKRLVRIRKPSRRSATRFITGGFEFKLIRREGAVAMLTKRKPGYGYESIEVVRLVAPKEKTIRGRLVYFEESLPPTGQWGVNGWTFQDIESADRKFDCLVRRQERKRRTTKEQRK